MLTVDPEEVGFSSERLERIPAAMQRFVARGDLAGTLTSLARHGKVFHAATTGLMDIESRRSMQPDTIFHIYSMTKPVTVIAVMMLLEEGLLLLDDPVADWLPEFARMSVFVRERRQHRDHRSGAPDHHSRSADALGRLELRVRDRASGR